MRRSAIRDRLEDAHEIFERPTLQLVGPSTFGVVMADPPWKFNNAGNRASPDHNLKAGGARAAAAYETMSLDDVCAMPVPEICDADALLGLWAPNAMLLGDGESPSPASRVCCSWGFRPLVAIPWIKGRWKDEDSDELVLHIGLGNYVRHCTEYLVLGVRGKLKVPPAHRLPGLISARRRHSQKPDVGRDFLSALHRDVPCAELFAREKVEGWHGWGDEYPETLESLSRVLGRF